MDLGDDRDVQDEAIKVGEGTGDYRTASRIASKNTKIVPDEQVGIELDYL
jgi:hypothetical protein